MKVGIVSQWYPPEPGPASLPGELARELARRGHDVHVVTGFPNYPEGRVHDGYHVRRTFDEIVDGVAIRRVALYPSHDARALGRAANYASFGASAALSGLDVLADRDVVWVSNSPPSVALLMRRLRALGVPQVLHVLDLWPDNVRASGQVGTGRVSRAAMRGVELLTERSYALADRVLAITPGVVDLLADRGVPRTRLGYLPLWANETVFGPSAPSTEAAGIERRDALGVPQSRIVVLYAGAIGATQDLETLVDALATLPAQTAAAVECWIMGDGVGLASLEERVHRLPDDAPRVRLLGRRPMAEMPAWTAAADLCYVGLRTDDHARHTLPSKVQTTLAMAKPVLASVAGDVDQLVRELGVGFSSAGAGVPALGCALIEAVALGRQGLAELGQHARRVYEREFSLASAMDSLEAEFHALVPGDGPDLEAGAWAALTVRPARPSEVPAVVDLHLRSFPTFFLSSLGPRFLANLYDDLCSNPDAMLLVADSAQHALVGFVGGVMDESTYFASLRRRRAFAFVTAAAEATIRDPRIVPRLWRARSRDESVSVGRSGATLLTIGVDPNGQTRGVGTQLLHAFEYELATRGVAEYSLTTDARDNDATISFYESRGLRRVRQFHTPEGREMLEFVGRGKPALAGARGPIPEEPSDHVTPSGGSDEANGRGRP